MHICPPLPTALRDRRLPLALAPVALIASWQLQSSAVANRSAEDLGVEGVGFSLSDLGNVVLEPAGGAGQEEIMHLIVAIVTLVSLAAIAYFVFGIRKTMGRPHTRGRSTPWHNRHHEGGADGCWRRSTG